MILLARPRAETTSHPVTLRGAKLGEVQVNGLSSLLIEGCVVDRKFGAVTFGGWTAALRNRAAMEKAERPSW